MSLLRGRLNYHVRYGTHARGGIPAFRIKSGPRSRGKNNVPATRDWTAAPLEARCVSERRDLTDHPPALARSQTARPSARYACFQTQALTPVARPRPERRCVGRDEWNSRLFLQSREVAHDSRTTVVVVECPVDFGMHTRTRRDSPLGVTTSDQSRPALEPRTHLVVVTQNGAKLPSVSVIIRRNASFTHTGYTCLPYQCHFTCPRTLA